MKIENHLKDIPSFETDRLLLRKVTRQDLDDVLEFSSDPEVAHRMTWEKNDSKEETCPTSCSRLWTDIKMAKAVYGRLSIKKVRKSSAPVRWLTGQMNTKKQR